MPYRHTMGLTATLSKPKWCETSKNLGHDPPPTHTHMLLLFSFTVIKEFTSCTKFAVQKEDLTLLLRNHGNGPNKLRILKYIKCTGKCFSIQ